MFHFVDDIIYGDAVTLITKVGATLISSPARIQSTIMSQNIKSYRVILELYSITN
jgi:hypothetical protein